ncbi:hypothetical protein MesoLj131b_77350 (plasmid) [Mesorhizobium sp. 131-2-5]|nr:hypothetical protein MesoLj131b_77350 [Mesorhizobium sp. 131-2-5]
MVREFLDQGLAVAARMVAQIAGIQWLTGCAGKRNKHAGQANVTRLGCLMHAAFAYCVF